MGGYSQIKNFNRSEMKIESISEVTDGKKQEHVHHIEVLWDGGDWKRVKCTDPECDYELEIYYGDE